MPSLWVRKTLGSLKRYLVKDNLEEGRKGKDEGETTSSKAQRRVSLRGVKLKRAKVPTWANPLGALRDSAFEWE